MTVEEEKRPQESPKKRRLYYFWDALFIAFALAIIIVTPLALYWKNSAVAASYDSDRVVNIIGRYDALDKFGLWLVQEGSGWNYGDTTAPSEVKVKQGQKVTLRLTSFDVVHGFGLADYGIDEVAYPGKVAEVTFVADRTGRFIFQCTTSCGPWHDTMVGELIVEP